MDKRFSSLSPADQQEFLRIKEGLDVAARNNPLLLFHACEVPCGSPTCKPRERQHEFMAARDRIVLMAAGNRFGKTTANVVWSIIQHTPDELLPDRLKLFKRPRPTGYEDMPVTGRYIAPSEKALLNIVIPEVQRWLPDAIIRGERWDKAWTDKYKVLHMRDGGRVEFYTSEQEAAVFVGTSLDYIVIDEPTTEAIWHECWMRLTDRNGTARFGLTPVNMKGGGIGWLYRSVYKPGSMGESFEGTTLVPKVLRGSIHDNPDLTEQDISEALSIYDPDEREARESGEFVAFGGLIYPRFKKFIVPLSPENEDNRNMIQKQSVVCGLDPSYRRAGLVWVAFNDQNQGLIFHAAYLAKVDPLKLRQLILQGNSLWGLTQPPFYVMDPYAGGAHSMVTGQAVTMKTELQQLGIYTHAPKVLDSNQIVYGGVLNIKRRMAESPPSFAIGSCVHKDFLMEAEEYRTEDREDGVFQVVKEFDDGMDAMRYAFTTRPWYPRHRQTAAAPHVWVPGQAPDWDNIKLPANQEFPSAIGSGGQA